MLPTLQRKLFRDLYRLKGQVITIALVVASGIAAFIALRGNYASLEAARTTFYERQRFADVFAQLERAPNTVAHELARIPGVRRVQPRVAAAAMLPLEALPEPVRAQVLSLPADEALNAIQLHEGRRPGPGRLDEVVVLRGFAEAHRLTLGDPIPAVINGTRRELVIVGTATSPEYVIAIGAGSITGDPARFAVLWMDPETVAASFRMEGAFNDVSLALSPEASMAEVVHAVDRILTPYGGRGAITRARQPSNLTLDGELGQLYGMSTILPLIFLAVAALLVNVVLSRVVHLQRPEIATLKAVGYTDAQVAFHFLELVLVVACLGTAAGIALGVDLGARLVGLYEQYFKFPDLAFRLEAREATLAAGVSVIASVAGAMGAVRQTLALPPAEAMRPEAPLRYRRSIVDILGLARAAGPSLHMIVRELERRPIRAFLSVLAIAASTGLSVVGGWYYDGIEQLVESQFSLAMREDTAVTFLEPRPERAVRELAHLPGVVRAEGLRVLPVRFQNGHRYRDGAIMAYADGSELRTLRDRYGRRVELPPDGVVLTDILAEILDVRVGESLLVEVREGQRPTRSVVVSGVVDEAFGLQGHMRVGALRDWNGEPPVVSMALLSIDPAHQPEVARRLKDTPMVLDVTRRAALLEQFREQSGNIVLTAAIVISLFAATITVGVVYNNARIALAMRARDFASLRVLGFTRREVSMVLLGELAVQLLVAVPIGLLFGRWLVFALAATVDPETYRLPVILTAKSYAFAALVTLVAGSASALLIRRRIDRLDLVAVLKTRE